MTKPPVIVIAEAGVNHNGDIEIARQLIEVAAKAGADYIKFQSFKAKNLVTTNAEKASYQKMTTDSAESQFEMLRRLELSDDAHRELQVCCNDLGIGFLSTPFDTERADFLVSLGVDLLKVPSGEVTNLPYLRHLGGLNLPIILSTGMSYLDEVRVAIKTIEAGGCKDITVLHCLTDYPAAPAEANLNAIRSMAAALKYPIGYSDHTPGKAVTLAAVALGSVVIEKHFTLDRTFSGPDHAASLEPMELMDLVSEIRIVETALGDGIKRPTSSEIPNREVARRSLVALVDINVGDFLTAENIVAKRPGTGIPPSDLDNLIGNRAKKYIPADSLLREDMF